MVVTTFNLREMYREYTDVNGKIKRDVENGILFPLVKGIYETNSKTDGLLLSAYIYGPSYLSFEYALSYHNMIPERVIVYTNATFNKRKSKLYSNHFGVFAYRDVPKDAFPLFVQVFEQDTYAYFMASPEKALCDLLYIKESVKSMKELKTLLFEDIRINRETFNQLNFNDIIFLADKYLSNNIKYLKKYIEGEYIR